MNSPFFTEFLYFTELRTGLFIGLLIGLFVLVRLLAKREVNLPTQMLLATFIGLGLGVAILATGGFPDAPTDVRFIAEINVWYGLVADGFMSLLRMLVIPLVLVSIIRVIIQTGVGANLGKLTARTVGMLIATTVVAALIGISMTQLFQIGVNADMVYGDSEIREISTIASTFLNLLPDNPFGAMAEGTVIPVIIFAVFVGAAIKSQMKKHAEILKPFTDFIEAFYHIIMGVADIIIKWMPYAVIALLANTLASRGFAVFTEVLGFAIAFVLAILAMFAIHLIIISFNGLSPLQYMKNVSNALVLGFTSRSSLGTLPVTIKSLTTKAGLDQGTATFIGSLGANGGMNGSAGIYSAMVTTMIANMVGHPVDLTFILMLVLVISLSSFGIAGIPGAITLTISITLSAVGLGEFFPLMAAVLAIDPLLDMPRTFLNINGTTTTAITVGKSMNQLDTQVFNAKT